LDGGSVNEIGSDPILALVVGRGLTISLFAVGLPKKRVKLAGLRSDVAFATEEYGMTERRACKLLDVDRSSYRYEPRPDHNARLRKELVAPARQKPRYGYRRLHALLIRRGMMASPQRVVFIGQSDSV
jgi:hypothetical protein